MTAVQIIILVFQLFVLYLTFGEMRKARQQQVLPFVAFGGGGGTHSGRTVTTKLRISNQGTGPAVKVRVYLGKQEVGCTALLSSGDLQEWTVSLSQNEEGRELPQGGKMDIRAEYEDIHSKRFASTMTWTKKRKGFPELIQNSFSRYQEKSLFDMLEAKIRQFIRKYFSRWTTSNKL